MQDLISNTSESAIQLAIHAELTASQMYKNLANQCQRLGYFGAAKYFRAESASELEHYQKHVDFLNDRGCVAEVPDLDAADDQVKDLEDALTIAYEAEVELGNKYSKWFSSLFNSDPMTAQFLLQFLEIQRGAIGEYGDWLQRLKLAGSNSAAILLIDQELGA